MLDVSVAFPLPLPDDPNKWDGWSKYNSSNLYERLCLDPQENPTNEAIEEHCRELLRWWQKKLPLKNQPTNPIAQLLGRGLDESSRYLTEARMDLLDPARRRVMDNELAAQKQEQAIAEFHKYLTMPDRHRPRRRSACRFPARPRVHPLRLRRRRPQWLLASLLIRTANGRDSRTSRTQSECR